MVRIVCAECALRIKVVAQKMRRQVRGLNMAGAMGQSKGEEGARLGEPGEKERLRGFRGKQSAQL